MKKVILSLAVLIYSAGSFAACTKADLTGTWVGYSLSGLGGGGTEHCNFSIIANGSIKAGSICTGGMFHTENPITGKLSIDSECHVTGSISESYSSDPYSYQSEIDAYISKGKDSLTGTKEAERSTSGKDLFVASKIK